MIFAMMRQALALRHAHRLRGEIGHLNKQIDGLIRQVGCDPLTGLLNRRAVHDRLNHELTHGRTFGHPIAIVMIDVDNFKSVNDTLGHDAGDRVLVAVGSILTATCRGTDVAARYAGDEFLLVLPGLNETQVAQVGDRIVQEVRRLGDDLELGRGVKVTLSIGAAVTHLGRRTVNQVIAIADAAMYDAKETGKDRVVTIDADTLLTPGLIDLDRPLSRRSTYLPAPFYRPISERRSPDRADRAS